MVCIVEVMEDGSEEQVPAFEAVPRPRLALQGPDDRGAELPPPIRLLERPRLHYRVPLPRAAPGLAVPTSFPLLLQMRGDGDEAMDDSSAAAAHEQPAAVSQPDAGTMEDDAPESAAASRAPAAASLPKRGHTHVDADAPAADDSASDRNSDSDAEPPFKRLRVKAPRPAPSPAAKRKVSLDNVQEHFDRCCIRSKS